MAIIVSAVKNRRDLKRFVTFPIGLLGGNPNYVPPLVSDDLSTLSPRKNPAFENAEAQFLAHRNGRIVGRVGHHQPRRGTGSTERRTCASAGSTRWTIPRWPRRFSLRWRGGAVRGAWRPSRASGFTDLDPEGMLVEGFDELATIAVIWTPPYYPRLLERLGFAKEVDYIEFEARTPASGVPERMARLGEFALKRNKFTIARSPDPAAARRARQQELFDLLDEVYDELNRAAHRTTGRSSTTRTSTCRSSTPSS